MASFQYKRAPITEAVVEFRFTSSPNSGKQDKAFKNLKKFYSDHNEIKDRSIELEVKPDGDPVTNTTYIIKNQFSSVDMTQILTVSQSSFLVSQLAPYQGWSNFKERIIRDWDIWNKYVGFKKVERIGMRYINRIDIPITDPVTEYEEFVTVYPSLPKIIDPCLSHSVNVKVGLDDINSILTLNSAVVQSPIPDHIAIVIDLDISRKYKSLQSNNDIYEFIELARKKKNYVFEACITDKARELFNK